MMDESTGIKIVGIGVIFQSKRGFGELPIISAIEANIRVCSYSNI